jgi:hypothetical protein
MRQWSLETWARFFSGGMDPSDHETEGLGEELERIQK